jgi:hypothetical protein
MAAWRYGDQFGRRWRKNVLYTTAIGAVGGSLVWLGPAIGLVAGSGAVLLQVAARVAELTYQLRRVHARITVPGLGAPIAIRQKQLNRISIVCTDHGWGLRIPCLSDSVGVYDATTGRRVESSRWNAGRFFFETSVVLTGADALSAAARVLAAVNAAGAKPAEVRSAVDIIEEVGNPEALFTRFATRLPAVRKRFGVRKNVPGHALMFLPKEARLALEMATHEESERRALEGELSTLEAAWQEAEEIAIIADDLFVSDETRAKLATLRTLKQSESEER